MKKEEEIQQMGQTENRTSPLAKANGRFHLAENPR